MREAKENLPMKLEAPGTALRASGGWGGMSTAYVELPAGTDLGPLLKGLPDDRCPTPHWGYVVKGQMTVSYLEGEDDVLRAGDVFYIPPGHTGVVQEDFAFIEFSPEKEFQVSLDNILKQAGG